MFRQLGFLNLDRYTLRQRLGLGMAVIIVPLLLVSSLGYGLFRYAIDVIEGNHEEVQYEMMPVIRLQALLLQAQMPPNDFLIHGAEQEIHQFRIMEQQIDAMFEEALAAPFEQESKRAHVVRARATWGEASRLGRSIFELQNPVGNPRGTEMMIRFDALTLEAHHDLEYITVLGLGELSSQHDFVHQLQMRANVAIVMLLLVVTLGVLIGALLLQRWIVAPLDVLREGAEQLGEGNLHHRIPVHACDEIGRVAETFNGMAESLQHDRDMLHSLAIHDQLTGLLNLREFRTRLELEIDRARRHGRHIGVLMIDIDFFKTVNDRFGHPAGDVVIKGIAERIRSTVRPNDVSARYGGEEFIIVLAETDADGAVTMAERLCERVRAVPFTVTSSIEAAVTISVGAAVFPADAATAEGLIEAADRALYAAKAAGRDRVETCSALPKD